MKQEYINWTRDGLKTATTRMKLKICGEYELVSGSYYKPKKSKLIIEITDIWAWTLNNLNAGRRMEIVKAENFKSWSEFMEVIQKINKDVKIDGETLFYTHFYRKVGVVV
jgi:hypothetical protein